MGSAPSHNPPDPEPPKEVPGETEHDEGNRNSNDTDPDKTTENSNGALTNNPFQGLRVWDIATPGLNLAAMGPGIPQPGAVEQPDTATPGATDPTVVLETESWVVAPVNWPEMVNQPRMPRRYSAPAFPNWFQGFGTEFFTEEFEIQLPIMRPRAYTFEPRTSLGGSTGDGSAVNEVHSDTSPGSDTPVSTPPSGDHSDGPEATGVDTVGAGFVEPYAATEAPEAHLPGDTEGNTCHSCGIKRHRMEENFARLLGQVDGPVLTPTPSGSSRSANSVSSDSPERYYNPSLFSISDPSAEATGVLFGPSPDDGPHVFLEDAIRLARDVTIPAILAHQSVEVFFPVIREFNGERRFDEKEEREVADWIAEGIREMITNGLTGMRKICRLDEDGEVRPVAYAAYILEDGREAAVATLKAQKAKDLWMANRFTRQDVGAPPWLKMLMWLHMGVSVNKAKEHIYRRVGPDMWCRIIHFFVRPDCWRQGYGTELMERICRDMDRYDV
ncbi:hypothetical protein VTK26DRAFT_6629 [Humicola hyalothermophila]